MNGDDNPLVDQVAELVANIVEARARDPLLAARILQTAYLMVLDKHLPWEGVLQVVERMAAALPRERRGILH